MYLYIKLTHYRGHYMQLVKLVAYVPQVWIRTDAIATPSCLLFTDQKKAKLPRCGGFSPGTGHATELTPGRTMNEEHVLFLHESYSCQTSSALQQTLSRHFHLLSSYTFFKVSEANISFLKILI